VRVSLICAASQNGVIGIENRLPWKLPADLKHFKALTLNHPVLMGRKTYESIGKALSGRTNVVITRQKDFKAPECLTASSIEKALELCKGNQEVFVIGGASVYQQALELADKVYLTLIHQNFEGDVFLFPLEKTFWKETAREDFKPDTQNPYPYSFLTFEKQK